MEQIAEHNEITKLTGKRDVVLITLGVSRADGKHITDGQKNAAMEAAKSVLQIIGADVDANSTALFMPLDDVGANDSVLVNSRLVVSIEKANEETSEPSEGVA